MCGEAISAFVPAPFACIQIPGGRVTLSGRGGYIVGSLTCDVKPFGIARYPITNAQYELFLMADDGYKSGGWWQFSEEAAQWYAGQTSTPLSYGAADHPRTHVTWYEAVAFCRWLSHRTGENVRLPREVEWQLAAQGVDHRSFPWGDEWDSSRCHHNLEHNAIGTLPVQTFEGHGDSPYGVVDMIGNVWEWSLTGWFTGDDALDGDSVRVLRGGSWFDDIQSMFTVTARSGWNVDMASDLRGFRIAIDID